jgi:hypothetical protein
MNIPHDVAVEAYKALGLTQKTRRHPEVLVRHCIRQVLSKGMVLRQIQDVEGEVVGKRPHHTTILHSITEMRGQVDIHLPQVLYHLSRALANHNNQKLMRS